VAAVLTMLKRLEVVPLSRNFMLSDRRCFPANPNPTIAKHDLSAHLKAIMSAILG